MARSTRTATKAPATTTTTDATPTTEEITVTPTQTPNAPATDTATVLPQPQATRDEIIEAYRAASVGDKAKIRAAVQARMMAAIDALDVTAAANAKATLDALTSTKAPAVRTVDYAGLVRTQVATLLFAAHGLMIGSRPVDVPADVDTAALFTDKDRYAVAGLFADLFAIDGTDEDRARTHGARLAQVKVGAGTRAAKRDVGAHITEALSGHRGAFRTVAEIARTASATYGDDRPSTGAVAAHLFRDNGPADPAVKAYRKGSTLPDGTTARVDGAIMA